MPRACREPLVTCEKNLNQKPTRREAGGNDNNPSFPPLESVVNRQGRGQRGDVSRPRRVFDKDTQKVLTLATIGGKAL